MMHVATTREELAEARSSLQGTVAFVPTMGALHVGHRSLLVRARGLADHVVVSIFVNPLQFGPTEDLDRYPRTREADLAVCAEEGVSLVFMPSRDVMYPTEPLVRVSAGPIGERFEGASRPGHFDGVLTVVAKLFGLVQPDVAVFSRKDAQQLALVKRMVADLDLGVRIDAAPFVRDADGLALSSRNRYLSSGQRNSALALPSALAAAALEAEKGATPQVIVATSRGILESTDGLEVDYVALVDPETFTEIGTASPGGSAGLGGSARSLLIAAVWVGATRLIDNLAIAPGRVDADSADSSAPIAAKG